MSIIKYSYKWRAVLTLYNVWLDSFTRFTFLLAICICVFDLTTCKWGTNIS